MRDTTKMRMEISNVELELHANLIIEAKKRNKSLSQFVRDSLHARIREIKNKKGV